MSQILLDNEFHILIMPKIRYALCAWGGFLTQTQKGLINAFLCRMYKYNFVIECFKFDAILDDGQAMLRPGSRMKKQIFILVLMTLLQGKNMKASAIIPHPQTKICTNIMYN